VVEVLPQWTPNSPDLNLTENVWGFGLVAEVNKAGCKNFDEFQAKVQEVFKNLSPQHLSSLLKGMKGRIEGCVAKKGAGIKHKVFEEGWRFAPTGGGRNDRESWGCGTPLLKALSSWPLLPPTCSPLRCGALYGLQPVHLMV
jgi:hypothetical protein